jgi:hypothetical protein
MKQLMVVTHDTYASGLTPASSDIDALGSLASGAWAMIDKDPSSATYDQVVNIAATSEADTPAKFQLVVRSANGLKFSPIITKANATCTYKAYVAKVAKVMNIAVSLTSLAVGDEAGFIVTDLSKPVHQLTRNRTYSYEVQSGDDEAAVVAALITLVNADTLKIVTASSGTDIVLTGDTAGIPFQVSPIGIFRDATITQTTAVVLGNGIAADLAKYELECEVRQGNANYPQYRDLNFTPVSEVDTSTPGTYDTWIVKHKVPNQRAVIASEENVTQEIVIAALTSLSDSGDGKSVEGLTNFDADLGNE